MTKKIHQQKFLKDIIDLAFGYIDDTSSEPEIKDFLGYLSQKLESGPITEEEGRKRVNSEYDDLGVRLVLLNRYAKEYVKIALENTELQTTDEFPFLIILFSGESPTKSELIDKMLLTKTTGAEILKRLKKKELITEFADENDKRSIRVNLTDKGEKQVKELLPRMGKVSELLSGNLSSTELRKMNHLLKKLSSHHRRMFKEKTKEEIQSTILNKRK